MTAPDWRFDHHGPLFSQPCFVLLYFLTLNGALFKLVISLDLALHLCMLVNVALHAWTLNFELWMPRVCKLSGETFDSDLYWVRATWSEVRGRDVCHECSVKLSDNCMLSRRNCQARVLIYKISLRRLKELIDILYSYTTVAWFVFAFASQSVTRGGLICMFTCKLMRQSWLGMLLWSTKAARCPTSLFP